MRPAGIVDQSIEAFHGTLKPRAEEVLLNQAIKPSENSYDWLGHGVYFWEGSANHAIQWAVKHHGRDACVLRATVYLGRCLDLMDTKYVPLLLTARDELEENLRLRGATFPVNQQGRNDLDCAVIEWILKHHLEADTVRGAFTEGNRLFPGSMFQDLTHIQVAVRNPLSIRGPIEKVYEVRSP
jgi:hypothetical protein